MRHSSAWDFVADSFLRFQFDDDAAARAPRARMPRERPDATPTGITTPSPTQYVSGDPAIADGSEYNVEITFLGSWSTDLRQAVIVAAEAISDFILGDVPAFSSRRKYIDDIAITASLSNIDGSGGILAKAGPDVLRPGSHLPARGSMQFDLADANALQSSGTFDDTVLHEMIHTIGFGTIWNDLGLVSDGSYIGARANEVYPGAEMIPLAVDGGASTAYSHWSDLSALGYNELMTGSMNGDNQLSYATIASLADLGYGTVSGASYAAPWFV